MAEHSHDPSRFFEPAKAFSSSAPAAVPLVRLSMNDQLALDEGKIPLHGWFWFLVVLLVAVSACAVYIYYQLQYVHRSQCVLPVVLA